MGKWMVVSTLRTLYVLHISVQTTKEVKHILTNCNYIIVLFNHCFLITANSGGEIATNSTGGNCSWIAEKNR